MNDRIVWKGETEAGFYQVVDTVYYGRSARVLYSGKQRAAQSGIPTDGKPELLFDYNQRLAELADVLQPRSVLIIGGGAGTLATALLAAHADIEVTMVEPNSELTKIAYKYFDLPVDERLRVHHKDGVSYLGSSTVQYDLIVLDAFLDSQIPEGLQGEGAFKLYKRSLKKGGVFSANIISGYYSPFSKVLTRMCNFAKDGFEGSQLYLAAPGLSLWLPQNFILLCGDTAHNDIGQYIGAVRQEMPPED